MIVALGVLAVSFVLSAARRFSLLHIGRPAGALLGAVALVILGTLTPAEAYAAVDLNTLGLLFGGALITAATATVGVGYLIAVFAWSGQ
jgi:hypothetical protein